MILDSASYQTILAFADDEHMVGSRHAAWIGMGPFLEEDLAFCSIAQDELGHAIALYELLVEPAEINRFGLLRQPAEYRSCWLAEAECATWSDALVRHWLYDRAEELRWQALAGSSVPELAALVAGAQREEQFHRDHAATYMQRMSAQPDAREKILASAAALLPLGLGLWEPVADEPDALAAGTITESSAVLGQQWKEKIQQDLEAWDLAVSWPSGGVQQNERTQRSAGFDDFLHGLQEVIVLDADAIW